MMKTPAYLYEHIVLEGILRQKKENLREVQAFVRELEEEVRVAEANLHALGSRMDGYIRNGKYHTRNPWGSLPFRDHRGAHKRPTP